MSEKDEFIRKPRTCTPKTLPKRLLVKAAETAVKIYPVNAPVFGPIAAVAADLVMDPQRLAVITGKYWGPTPRRLTVSFIGSTPANLRNRIISHLNAWTQTGCIEFVYTQETGQVRISRGPGGCYSYLGTDILLVPKNRPTMNLEGFTMNTPESEFKRVILHETGHTLGFPHERMRRALVERIDREKAYSYFRRTQGWDRATVDAQVLTPLDERSIMATPADQDSIMCYQLPAEITRDGRPILGGRDINPTDYEFASRIYPKPRHDVMPEHKTELLTDSGAQFYFTLEGEAARGNVVQYGTAVDLIFNYDSPPADALASVKGEELEHMRVNSLTLGVTVIPKGFEFRAKTKWYQTAHFHGGKLVKPLRFPLRALDEASIASNIAELPPNDTAQSEYRSGFHILLDLKGAKLYQLFLATRLVGSQAKLNKAAADYHPHYIDLDKMYRLASLVASATLAASVWGQVPIRAKR